MRWEGVGLRGYEMFMGRDIVDEMGRDGRGSEDVLLTVVG